MRRLASAFACLSATLLGGQVSHAREVPDVQKLAQALPGRPPALTEETPPTADHKTGGRDLAIRHFGSGTVTQARDGELIDKDSEEPSRHLELVRPVPLATNLAADINSFFMSQELMNDINTELYKRTYLEGGLVGQLRFQQSFFTRDTLYFVADRDDRTARPFGNGITYEEEIALRRQFANGMKDYMLMKGIPKFLGSRQETQPIAKVYNQTVGVTSVSFQGKPNEKTKYVWRYSMAVNPYKKESEIGASNTVWRAMWRQNLTSPKDLMLVGGRSVRLQGRYPLELEVKYHLLPKVVHPAVWRMLRPNLVATLETDIPMAAADPLRSTFTKIKMDYLF